MNIRNTVVFASSGRARIRVLICFRIDGNAFIDLKGLTTRNILNALRFMSKLNSSIKLYKHCRTSNIIIEI